MSEQDDIVRDCFPWRLMDPDLWSWEDVPSDVEAAIRLDFEPNGTNEHGSMVVNIHADSPEMLKIFNGIADDVAAYILENPRTYGLQPIPRDK